MIAAVLTQDSAAAVRSVAQLLDQGHDVKAYCADLVEHVRNLLVAAVVSSPQGPQALRGLIDLSDEELQQIAVDAKAFSAEQLQELFRIFSQAEDALRLTAHPRFVLEVAAVRATRLLRPSAPPSAAARPGGGTTPEAAPPRPVQAPPQPQRPAPARAQTPVAPPQTAPSRQSVPKRDEPRPPVGQKPVPGGTQGPANMAAKSVAPGLTAEPAPRPVVTTTRPAEPAPSPAVPLPAKPSPVEQSVSLHWEALLERVEAVHPNIAPFLAQGMLLPIEGSQVTIGFPKTASVAFARMQNTEPLRQITDLCTEVARQPVRLRLIELADGQAAGPSMAQIRATKERDQKHALLEGTRSHPLVKQALEVFGGDLVEVRQVSPRKETPS
jgi:DNA polymerase-3 subunit gamma/tau